MSETSKTKEPTKIETCRSLGVSISGVSLFTSLLVFGVIGPAEYSYLITLTVFVALAILFGSRIGEIGFGGIKLILKIEKEVSEIQSSVKTMQMAIEEIKNKIERNKVERKKEPSPRRRGIDESFEEAREAIKKELQE